MSRRVLLASLLLLAALGCGRQPPGPTAKPGTLAVINARIWTGDDAQPWAQALVIDGSTLALVGTNEDARKANAEQVVDAGGRLIVPGFTDAHTHFREGGFGLASVQLRIPRPVRARQARGHARLQDAVTLGDTPLALIVARTVQRRRQSPDELPRGTR